MKPLKYYNESLKQFCLENSVELCRDYSGEVVKRVTKIEGKCKIEGCNNIFNKSFREIVTHNDIFIPSQNRCIEVKSDWTYNIKSNNIELKQQATKELGYKYEIWIYNKNGIKTNCYQ